MALMQTFRNDAEIIDCAHRLPFIGRYDEMTLDRITADYTRAGALIEGDRVWVLRLIEENGSV